MYCTHPFCPPEALGKQTVKITPAIDAYSIGATLYYAIYQRYLYDYKVYKRHSEVLKLFENGHIHLPTTVSLDLDS